jgi:kynurenine formamidase
MGSNWPQYQDLPFVGDTSERHAWDVFGRDDELGCLNFVTAESIRSAASEIHDGTVINLDLPIGQPEGGFWSGRALPRRTETSTRRSRDDKLDDFYLQGGTQWDALKHYRFREYGYFGGRQDADLDERGEIGIDRWAENGIIGRGILLDVAAYLERRGTPLAPNERLLIDQSLMRDICVDEKVEIQSGDIVLLRTGWLSWFLERSPEEREKMGQAFRQDRASFRLPGVDPRIETVEWVWNSRIAAIAIDTPTFDALEYRPEDGWAHQRMLALLGLAVGELWALDELGQICAERKRYSFFFTSSPLYVREGAGSPGNAYAIL